MSQSEMSTCPPGAENTAAVKVHQGLSGHRLLPAWPDPRDASGLRTSEPQEGDPGQATRRGSEGGIFSRATTGPPITF